jgi:hypothetical protein
MPAQAGIVSGGCRNADAATGAAEGVNLILDKADHAASHLVKIVSATNSNAGQD